MRAGEGYNSPELFAIALREPLPAIPLIGSFIIGRANIRVTPCVPHTAFHRIHTDNERFRANDSLATGSTGIRTYGFSSGIRGRNEPLQSGSRLITDVTIKIGLLRSRSWHWLNQAYKQITFFESLPES